MQGAGMLGQDVLGGKLYRPAWPSWSSQPDRGDLNPLDSSAAGAMLDVEFGMESKACWPR